MIKECSIFIGSKMKKIIILFLISSYGYSQTIFEMPSIFNDNMVLQQKSNVTFWGKAQPKSKINIQASWGAKAFTVANSDSVWQMKIKTPKYGGPYSIIVKTIDKKIVFKNVMIGEVWLCSGQSNMEMPLEGWPPSALVEGSDEAIKNSYNPLIRYFNVTRKISDKPEFNCEGEWVEQNPQTSSKFSATAFFFAQKLYNELKVPIGLIHSSWGGTPIEAWTSGKSISSIDKFKSIIELIEQGKKDLIKLNDWLSSKRQIDISERDAFHKWSNLDFDDANCSNNDFDDSNWKVMNLPTNWENTEVGNFDGVVWFREKLSIPINWKNQDLILELGPIDDMDVTFVNGIKIGGYETDGFWDKDRIYEIPASLVQDTIITIAVRVIDTQGGGGFWGTSNKLKIHPKNFGQSFSLANDWKYLPVAEYRNGKFFVFGSSGEYFNRPKLSIDFSAYTPSTLYNGMIAPLIPYEIKGVIWYQGESNTKQPELYKSLFPLLISNWRDDWHKRFSFYYVQIAPWNYGDFIQSQKLREAQFLTLQTPRTGMAVTLDIGDIENIHPAKKKEVGERLALWALAKDYRKNIVPSGPVYKSMKIKKDKVEITLDYADGLKFKLIDDKNNFLIAGEDRIFKEAKVEIKKNKLIVFSDKINNPKAVRYCWDNTSSATLFNKYGLPASSFRTDNWPE